MAHDPNNNGGGNEPESVSSYYTHELFDFHLDGSKSASNKGKMENVTGDAGKGSQSTLGQVVSTASTAMGMIGELMSLPMQASEALLLPLMEKLKGLQGIACLPMAKHLDPVLGIDVHNVMFPPVAAPVPLPHPHIAMVFEAPDWVMCAVMSMAAAVAPEGPDPSAEGAEADTQAAVNLAFNAAVMVGSIGLGMLGMNATVKTGGMTPRGSTGSKGEVIPHFPMGPAWHPAFHAAISKNNCHLQFGSLFVNADTDPLAGFMHPCNICWDLGSPQVPRKKKKPKPRQVFLPTGFLMAIPWNNVLVNPVPTPINPQQALSKLFGAGLKKLKMGKKKALAFQKKLGNTLKKMGLPPGVIRLIQKGVCKVIGHPVDVATGDLFTDEEDFNLPGPIPLSWERTWYSSSTYQGPLGHGWHHSYDMAMAIDVEENFALLRMADGRMTGFDLPNSPAEPSFNRTEKLHLHLHEEGYFYVTDKDDLIYRFTERKYAPQKQGSDLQLLQSISNRNGFAIRFAYSDTGNLKEIIDSAGRNLQVQSDAQGRISEIRAPHPEQLNETFAIARYEYDDLGNMVRQTNALGDSMEFTYARHLLVEETWRNGSKWFFRWDGVETGSHCIETWGDGDLYHYNIEYKEGVTHAVNGLGVNTTYYHRNGLVYNEIDGNGESWTKQFNRFNELEIERDPLGNETVYSHDQFGNVTTITDPAGGFESREYWDPQFPHALTEAMDTNGGKWKFSYDEQGNLVKRINPKGAILKIDYKDGLPAKIHEETGGTTLVAFDQDYNLAEVVEPLGATWKYSHDVLGRCTLETNPNRLKRELTFDLVGRVTKVHDYDGNRIHLDYDGIDNILHYRDAQKNVKYTYRGLWKMTSRTEAGHTIYFNYDSEEQLRGIVNEKGLPYHFALDNNGNVLREVGFDGLTREYTRNPAGWVTRLKRPSGHFTQYAHDANGRVTEVEYHTGEKEAYSYYPSGLLKSAINADAKVESKRDALGQVIEESCNGEAISSEYDNVGRRVSLKSSLGADINYAFDIQSNVTSMAAGNAQTRWESKLKYDTLGLEIERMLPGGLTNHWKRDDLGRPVEQSLGHGNSTKHQRRYKWGINDRLSEILDSVTGKATFTHDERGYLTGAKYDGKTQLRNPDAVGNLFETDDRSDRKYGNGGRLLKKGATTYEYDAEGNLSAKKTPKGTWHYEWNAAGMLSKVIRPDNEEVTFAYDALGRRIWKKFKKTITNFAWDGNVPLHEWKTFDFKEGSADDLITWFFESDGFVPAGKIRGDKQYSICADHLGTPSRVYDAEGALVWHMELDSYGRERVLKGDVGACPFRYQGQYVDAETGLYYNRFRYFDAEDGRYMSQDPIRAESEEANFYIYTSDPFSYVDRFGLKAYADLAKKKELGLEGVSLRGKSWNAGRKKLEANGFVFKGKTKTGRLEMVHPKTGTVVSFDGNQRKLPGNEKTSLIKGQSPHWHVKDSGNQKYSDNGLPASQDKFNGHIPGK